jgi:hypothetical protein
MRLELQANCIKVMFVPKFSILIPWSNRPEVETTLRENAGWFRANQAEVLVLNCGGDSGQLCELLRNSRCAGIRQIDIPKSGFNKCLALNIGIHSSLARRLFVLDADVILKSDILAEALPILKSNAFVTVGRVYESNLQPLAAESIGELTKCLATDSFVTSIVSASIATLSFRDGTNVSVPTVRRHAMDGSRAGCGLLLAMKEHFIAVGGYNSALEYWGWEDNDIRLRLRRVLSLSDMELGEALHISHGDAARSLDGRSPMQTNAANFYSACGYYSRGDFSGTYCQDIRQWYGRTTESQVEL